MSCFLQILRCSTRQFLHLHTLLLLAVVFLSDIKKCLNAKYIKWQSSLLAVCCVSSVAEPLKSNIMTYCTFSISAITTGISREDSFFYFFFVFVIIQIFFFFNSVSAGKQMAYCIEFINIICFVKKWGALTLNTYKMNHRRNRSIYCLMMGW